MSFKKVLNLIAKFQTKHPYITILIILAISIAFYGGSTQVQTVASLEKMMPTQIEEIAAFNDLRDANLGQDMIAVVVRVNREGTDPQGVMDITDYRILEYLDNLQNLLSQETDILEVHSYNEIVQRFNGGEIPTKEEYVQIISNPQAKAYLDQFINQDKSITILLAKTDISADDARMNSLTKKLQAHIETIGRLNAGEQKALSFYIDIVDGVDAKVYDIPIKIKYLDLDNNEYSALKEFKLLIKEKPQIQVINYSGSGLAGKKGILEVSLQNVGSETAEAVDVRLIKQSSQPFAFDVRSAYVGQLEPGETGLAIFNIDISRNAEFKEHDFKLFIRAKGDSDNGNNNIYTYSDRAKFSVDGKAPNYFLYIGLGILGLIILIVLIRIFSR